MTSTSNLIQIKFCHGMQCLIGFIMGVYKIVANIHIIKTLVLKITENGFININRVNRNTVHVHFCI